MTTPADGYYQPGRPTPLLITIEADGAVSGTLTATFEGFNAGSQQVDVPGGSTKQVVFTVSIPPWIGGGRITFTSDDGGSDAATDINLRQAGSDELVAVLPELAARDLPATASLATDIGVARLIPLDVELLDSGSDVLGPFTQVLGTAADLQALEGSRLDAVDSWVGSQGGLLVVDDQPDKTIALSFPDGLDTTELDTDDDTALVDYGLGRIRFTGGTAAAGGYDDLLQATPTRSVDEFPWGGGFGGGFPTTVILASDAGVRIPAIGSIVLLLVGYLLVAGPVLWLVLRWTRREPMLWLVLPAFALITTGAVYAIGQSLRDETSTAHATLVADLPTERVVSSQVLVTAPNGGTAGVRLDDDWRPVQVSSDEAFFDGPFPQNAQERPVTRGDNLEIDLPPGGIGVVAAETVGDPGSPSWSYELSAEEDRLVGTVTNRTTHDLGEAFVVSGSGFQRIGNIGAGETADVTLRNVATPPIEGDPFMNQAWQLDPFGGDPDGASNPGVLINWMSTKPELRSPGFVVIVGWTRDEPGPLDTSTGATVSAGRTAFLSATRLDDDLISADRGRVEFLRGWNSTRVEDEIGNACSDAPVTLRVTPAPEVLDGDVVLTTSTREVVGLDLWTGETWQPAGMANASDGELAIGVSDAMLADGSLTLRAQMSCEFWGMSDPFPKLRAANADDEILAIGALGSGLDRETDSDQTTPTTASAGGPPPPPPPRSAQPPLPPPTTAPADPDGGEDG